LSGSIGSLERSLRGGVAAAVVVVSSIACNALTGVEELVVATCEGADCESGDRRVTKDSTEPAADDDDDPRGSSAVDTGQKRPPSSDGNGSGTDAEGGDTDPAIVECGTTTCSGSNAACCVGASKACIEKGDACIGIVIECGGRSNCGQGDVCCFDVGAGRAECRPEGACYGGNSFVFCRSDADCPAGMGCFATAGSLPEHKVCR